MYTNSLIDIKNEAVVIDAKNNVISYVMEILPNGEIIKKYIDIKEQEKIIKELNLKNIKPNNSLNRYTKREKIKNKDKLFTTKTQITTWNKRKIIYEQKVEIINLK